MINLKLKNLYEKENIYEFIMNGFNSQKIAVKTTFIGKTKKNNKEVIL